MGLSLSLVCLLLCILTFLLVRPIQSSRTTVHLHLCVCLFVGSAIFLAGIEKETPDGEVRPAPPSPAVGLGNPEAVSPALPWDPQAPAAAVLAKGARPWRHVPPSGPPAKGAVRGDPEAPGHAPWLGEGLGRRGPAPL